MKKATSKKSSKPSKPIKAKSSVGKQFNGGAYESARKKHFGLDKSNEKGI